MEHPRITVEAGKMGGVPCIRGYRMPVETVVKRVAGGMSFDEILADYPFLQLEDIRAALLYAGESARLRHVPETMETWDYEIEIE